MLSGTRVVEYTGGVLSAYCGRLFAELGATVDAFEGPAGAALRREPPLAHGDHGPSLLHEHLWSGKSPRRLDLAVVGDRQAFEELLSSADVLIEDGGPDGPFAGELAPAAIHERWPRLSVVSLSQFGRTGPYSHWRGNELCAQAMGGIAYATGRPDAPPLKLAGQPFQYAAALAGFMGGLAALFDRRRSGRGRLVDVSVMEYIAANQELATLYTFMGLVRHRDQPTLAPFVEYSLHPCRDGYVDVGVALTDFSGALAALLRRPELKDDPRFATPLALYLNYDDLVSCIREAFADRDRDEIFHTGMQARFLCGPVLSGPEVVENPQLEARGFLQVEGPGPASKRPGPAIRFRPGDRTSRPTVPASIDSPAARRGDRLLAGVRVIDWTLAYAGPVGTRYLAELGADVIHVSSIQRPMRGGASAIWPESDPGDDPWNREGYTTDRYMGKREVTLDLTDNRGRDLFFRLLENADVLFENHSPRALKNLGLTYEEVSARLPGLIMVSLSAFGQEGPWANYSATGDVLEAACGMCDATGYPGGGPERGGMIYLDPLSGAYAAAATIAALEHRARTGRGGYVDNSMFETGVATFPETVLAAGAGLEYPARIGNGHPLHAPQGIYPCAGVDQWLAIAIDGDAAWGRLTEVLGRPDLAVDPRFTSALSRRQHREALDAAIGEATRGRDKWQLARQLQAQGVMAAPVLDMRETLLDPHLWERGLLQHVTHAAIGERLWTRQFPGRIAGADLSIPRPAPRLGEHNDEILGEELGLSPAELAALREAQVIGERPIDDGAAPMVLDLSQVAHYRGLREYDPEYRERLAQAGRPATAK